MSRAGESSPVVGPEQAGAEQAGTGQMGTGRIGATKEPLYPRLLKLRHVAPSAWQRAMFGEGSFLVAALLVMADVASAWTLVAVPLGVAAVVKFNDALVGVLAHQRRSADGPEDTFGA